ncbi:hypothetical protein ACXET9_02510 [Brachybacterium sp. DNPG3]
MDFVTPPTEHPRAGAIAGGTGVGLDDWARRLDALGARDLAHAAIAREIIERWELSGWWAQGVTVAYEQLIGRREIGQSSDGAFAASASRTVAGDPDAVRDAWHAFLDDDRRAALGIGVPALSGTERWRYWRADAEGAGRVAVSISAKPATPAAAARSVLGLDHKGLASAEERETWKTTWTTILDAFVVDREENR